MALNSKTKLGLLIRTIPKPHDKYKEEYERCSTCNDMVHSWILNRLAFELTQVFSYSKKPQLPGLSRMVGSMPPMGTKR